MESTEHLLERIHGTDSTALVSWLQTLTEDITNADEFSDDLTGVMAERGMVRNEIIRRTQQAGGAP